jgi:hypothetical protein
LACPQADTRRVRSPAYQAALAVDAAERGADEAVRSVLTACVVGLTTVGLSTRAALALAGYPKSSWYRHRAPPRERPALVPQKERVQPHALDAAETAQILGWLGEERFAHLSVQQVFWRVLDEGHYVASMRTWYRGRGPAPVVG